MKKLLKNWYWIIIGGFILFAALVYIILGENSVIAVHDNLDLFVPQYKMMKDSGTFFGHGVNVPFLANISRDYLPSEFNLYTLVFMIFPEYAAYIICYFLKIGIGLAGCILLAKDILHDRFEDYKPIIYLTSFAFAILNLFPNFGIAFAAIPLLVFIMHRIITKPHVGWYVALFCYPYISYFSYLGIFFIGYLCLYFIYSWISKRKFPWRVLVAIPVLSLGYAACEYRLFSQMLFSDIESIRSTMVQASLGWKDIFAMIWEGFAIGDMHTESVHIYFVMPACLLYFVLQTIGYIVKGKAKKIFTDYFNGVLLFIVFNSAFYGLYYWEPLRNLFEMILPPLKGFEFHRMEFVNPFLWYVAFFIILKRVYDYLPKFKWAADIFAVIAVLIVVFSPTRYNDLFHTCLSQYSQIKNGAPNNELTYKEYYSTDLFEKVKADINYKGEWAVAYGFYPAVLEYNGIHTLDGYLGYYSQFYKEEFRKIIAPALERVPESKSYYDIWGARCYMYSGTYVSNVNSYRNYEYTDEDLYIDIDAFKDYLGRYIFSRVKFNNAEEVGLKLVNVYTDENSPYTLYLYQTKSWFTDKKEHSNIKYEDRDMDYDIPAIEDCLNRINEAVEVANKKAEGLSDDEKASVLSKEELDKMDSMYVEAYELVEKMMSSYSMVQIEFHKDVTNDEINDKMSSMYEELVNINDRYLQTLREIAKSPYEGFLKGKISPAMVDIFKEYEDMTEEEKAHDVKVQALTSEYEQAVNEEYYFEYNGETWTFDRFNKEGGSLPRSEMLTIVKGLYAEKGKVLGEIYKELVQLYDEEAKNKGYDNYIEYAYESVFPRDYSVEDIKNLCEEVREHCQEAYASANNYMEYVEKFDPGFVTEDDTKAFTSIKPVLEEIDPELIEPLEHILDNNLYDMKPSLTKSERGFTLATPTYGDAFIFDSPYESSQDIYTYTHEYGHYTNAYYNNENLLTSLDNMDTAEIQSQGLEVLFNPHYREIYGEEVGDYLEANNLEGLLYAIYSSCLYTEFEIYVFEHPDESYEDYGLEFAKLFEEYGYDYEIKNGEGLYTWVDVPHFFSQPCYYIAYATSALAALDLYMVAQEDIDAAVTKYMQIQALSSEWLFKETLSYVGLPDVFEKGMPQQIFRKTVQNIKSIARKYM